MLIGQARVLRIVTQRTKEWIHAWRKRTDHGARTTGEGSQSAGRGLSDGTPANCQNAATVKVAFDSLQPRFLVHREDLAKLIINRLLQRCQLLLLLGRWFERDLTRKRDDLAGRRESSEAASIQAAHFLKTPPLLGGEDRVELLMDLVLECVQLLILFRRHSDLISEDLG